MIVAERLDGVRGEVVGEPARNIRARVEITNGLAYGIYTAGGDNIARKLGAKAGDWVCRRRIEDQRGGEAAENLGEVSVAHSVSGDSGQTCQSLPKTRSLIIAKKESLVFHDRPAEGATKLVPA